MKHFKCMKCGFEFSLAADFENMSKEEFAEVSACPCGAQMKIIRTIDPITINKDEVLFLKTDMLLHPSHMEKIRLDLMRQIEEGAVIIPNNFSYTVQKRNNEEAEEQGMPLPLPCKCGDSLWGMKVYKNFLVAKQGIVREMYFTQEMKLAIGLHGVCRGEFGKKIFRTKEETEQAFLDLGYVRSENNPHFFKLQK